MKRRAACARVMEQQQQAMKQVQQLEMRAGRGAVLQQLLRALLPGAL